MDLDESDGRSDPEVLGNLKNYLIDFRYGKLVKTRMFGIYH